MKKDHEGTIRKISDFLGFKPTDEQWPNILKYTSFAWMKEHDDKFLASTRGPVPLLLPGAMVRKGSTGSQKDDGMTDEVSADMRAWAEKIVPFPEAIKYIYEGGAIPPDE
jgi:aryl sulfotransferase